jgi:hypothetical protein
MMIELCVQAMALTLDLEERIEARTRHASLPPFIREVAND